ncbi:restriction endonuclease subunit S [Coleofasciculus sp. FACHB-SPT9]|uniref:restriction endonuclease subunit S n=1 Tax=Cyanophyceae TaxID=3028117 RepID=UPI0016893F19|nr:restriction endonuclease subunit S [Coleofasciculus sp. FACHB-SPT9]MBD1890479.1 restriction endonuclease subunit S [Coleofasciculus sp. FACHB-SPT9]
MRDWEETTLGELIDIKHGYAFKGEFFTEVPNGNALLTPGNFHIGGGFKADKFKYYIGDIPEDYVLSPGDVIVTMTDLSKDGDTLGYSARIPESTNRFLHNQRLGLVSTISKRADINFIYWLLRTSPYQKTIVNSCSGSTVKHTSPSKIKDYKFLLPPITEQVAIDEVLSSFERKIENLRGQNETLEVIAQTLFKHWFVDFEFPNEDRKPYKSSGGKMVRSVLGEIPVGWRVGKLGDVVETLGGGTPSTTMSEYWENGNIPWYSPTDLTRSKTLFSLGSEKKITKLGLEKSSAKLFPKYSLLLTSRATIGEITINTQDACTNQGFITIVPNQTFSVYFLYGWLLTQISLIKQLASGSTFPELSKSTFRNFSFLIPDSARLAKYDKTIKPIFQKIENNINQIQTLTKTRDVLLPKLMSGKLRITE